MKHVAIYTDGCAIGNPGKAGWGVVLVYGSHQKELYGFASHSTNNRMELQAIISGLSALKERCEVTVYTDSQITQKCAMGLNQSSANKDLWADYWREAEKHNVTVEWIRKDSHPLNHRAHELANIGAKSQDTNLLTYLA